MKDLKESLKNQISVLEKVQQEALKKGDMQKVQDIAHTIMSITNMINSLK